MTHIGKKDTLGSARFMSSFFGSLKLFHLLCLFSGSLKNLMFQYLISAMQRLKAKPEASDSYNNNCTDVEEVSPPCAPRCRSNLERDLYRPCYITGVISSPNIESVASLWKHRILFLVISCPV